MATATKAIIKTVPDEFGNCIICHDKGDRIVLYLKLNDSTRHRKLGFITISTKTFHVRREREKHLFKKAFAYGFNHKILSETAYFDKVRLSDEKQEWLIPVNYILKNGQFLFFKEQGFERQIFVTLFEIEQFERKKKI